MININLLPIRQIKQRIRIRKEALALIGGFLLLLVVLWIVGYSQAVKIDGLQKKKAHRQAEKRKYNAVLAQINRIKKERNLLRTKLKVIERLKENSQLPVRILDEIAKLTPPSRMWLKSLSMTNNVITLSGIALDNATIAQYMEQIKLSPFFNEADLANSSMIKVADKKLKSFTLSVRLNHP